MTKRPLHPGVILILALATIVVPAAVNAEPIRLENVTPYSTTAGADPNAALYTNNPGSFYDGVARLIISTTAGTFGCSGSLIGATSILTAAHCVDPTTFGGAINSIDATFVSGAVATGASWVFSPMWNGVYALMDGGDVGVVTLTSAVVGVTPYSLYSGLGFGSAADIAGFGLGGTGVTGATLPYGTFRHGQNEFDASVTSSGFIVPGTGSDGIFLYDFDSGTGACNSLFNAGLPSSVGLGVNEVMIAPGDSGGPSFIDGAVAGVHSFGWTFWNLDCGGGGTNASFGDFGGDTRVAANLDFIDSATAASVPEPASIWLIGSGLAGLTSYVRRRRR